MFVKPVVNPAFVADCHLTTFPVFTVKVIKVELVPVQTVVEFETPIPNDPPADAGLTLMVTLEEKAESHTPDFTTAL